MVRAGRVPPHLARPLNGSLVLPMETLRLVESVVKGPVGWNPSMERLGIALGQIDNLSLMLAHSSGDWDARPRPCAWSSPGSRGSIGEDRGGGLDRHLDQ